MATAITLSLFANGLILSSSAIAQTEKTNSVQLEDSQATTGSAKGQAADQSSQERGMGSDLPKNHRKIRATRNMGISLKDGDPLLFRVYTGAAVTANAASGGQGDPVVGGLGRVGIELTRKYFYGAFEFLGTFGGQITSKTVLMGAGGLQLKGGVSINGGNTALFLLGAFEYHSIASAGQEIFLGVGIGMHHFLTEKTALFVEMKSTFPVGGIDNRLYNGGDYVMLQTTTGVDVYW